MVFLRPSRQTPGRNLQLDPERNRPHQLQLLSANYPIFGVI